MNQKEIAFGYGPPAAVLAHQIFGNLLVRSMKISFAIDEPVTCVAEVLLDNGGVEQVIRYFQAVEPMTEADLAKYRRNPS